MELSETQRAVMAGREHAYARMFSFMRLAIHRRAAPEEIHAELPYEALLRQSLQAFRGANLTIPAGFQMSDEALAAAQRAYRDKFDELCTKLLDGLPEGG
jgi:hypothetical protein